LTAQRRVGRCGTHVCGELEDSINRNQLGLGEVGEVTGRGGGDGGVLRLALVEGREGATPTPASQDDPGVAQNPLAVANAGAKVKHDLLHDQTGVIIGITAGAAGDVNPGPRQSHWKWQKILDTHGVLQEGEA